MCFQDDFSIVVSMCFPCSGGSCGGFSVTRFDKIFKKPPLFLVKVLMDVLYN
jgi:hypothetical protein